MTTPIPARTLPLARKFLLTTLFAFALSGCMTSARDQNTGAGALIGGTGGAVIGGLATDSVGGAVVGGIAGAALGAAIGNTVEPRNEPRARCRYSNRYNRRICKTY